MSLEKAAMLGRLVDFVLGRDSTRLSGEFEEELKSQERSCSIRIGLGVLFLLTTMLLTTINDLFTTATLTVLCVLGGGVTAVYLALGIAAGWDRERRQRRWRSEHHAS